MTPAARVVAGLAVAAAAVALAACSSTPGHGTSASSHLPALSPSPAPTTPTPTPTTTSPTPTASSPTSAAATTSSAVPAPVSSAAPSGVRCALPALGVAVQRGGASLGHEIAIVQFSNEADSSCDVSGYAGAQLRRDGAPLGQAAGHEAGRTATVTLAPGATAQATLSVSTGCQAPLSDKVRITPPGGGYVDAALALRGCAMTIGPIEASG